jgi:quinol monooxygenase YgiN
MPEQSPGALHLTSEWFIQPGCEREVARVIPELVALVLEQEPDTLVYLVHKPRPPGGALQSLPPPNASSLLFFEVYRDVDAFHRHVNGAVFTRFVNDFGHLFIGANGKPFTFVEFLTLEHGFMRAGAGHAMLD